MWSTERALHKACANGKKWILILLLMDINIGDFADNNKKNVREYNICMFHVRELIA